MIQNEDITPSKEVLSAELGDASTFWDKIIEKLEEKYGALDKEWKPSKMKFGSICLLKLKKRTLLYLTPENAKIIVAIVLGERAVDLALKSDLPESIKTMIRETKPYVEGRGIRFPVNSSADIPVVCKLVEIKTTPK
jgi:hypothetical protein